MAILLRSRPRGFTLAELLIAGLLLSIVFVAATTTAVSALKFFSSLKANGPQMEASFAMEHITRKAALANKIVVEQGGTQLKIRWDYQSGSFAPNTTSGYSVGSTLNTADDRWIKYGLMSTRPQSPFAPPGAVPAPPYQIYWKEDTAEAGGVTRSDTRLEPNLTLYAGSSFASPAVNTLRVTLSTQTGTPPKPMMLTTDTVSHAASQ
ncbi:MAG: prepilin-type N-terminal cleavage/methylation domain-containing protein [Candidatus Omnitrophica bacterium]|nr:prepilin-type N-terminal cleavage/methylation domain-containing protein [Candidatus Omnitrophota bacterium]